MSMLDKDILDSREIEERIEELTAEFLEATETDPADTMSADDWAFGLSSDDAQELAGLIELRDKLSHVPDWSYGETVIREDEFADYCKEMVIDCGYAPNDFPEWLVIDWEETADNLREDYSEATVNGVTYLAR